MTTDTDLLLGDSLRLLEQGLDLLGDLDDDQYAQRVPALNSSIRGHVRHCVDFFDRFLEGVGAGRVDYDRRQRDERVEQERAAACAALERVGAELGAVDLSAAPQTLRIRLDGGDDPVWTRSSVERELVALTSHTIHHYALIAVALRGCGRAVPEGFGVAPSTLRHWARLDPCAP